MREYHVVGSCHTDLAWRGDEAQYAVYLEQFVVLMIDLLEQFTDFCYVIEQAYHYRSLEKRRPDLMEKLKKYIAEGRIEVVGGMISTMDTNMPCGESNVRNQLMGLNWFKENMNAEARTAWMYDAFGCHAQTPQLIAGFGMRHMMGSRFGGDKRHEIFQAEGLDGTRMLVAGHDCFSQNLPSDADMRVFVGFVPLNDQVDALFERASRSTLEGPLMILASIEDDAFPTRRVVEAERKLRDALSQRGDTVAFSTPCRFFEAVDAEGMIFPVESADLNPEFTGTFAQRIEIRMANRRIETEVLDAEKWLALTGCPWPQMLHDAWWELGFVHFHDVFTGSHPEKVFNDVMTRLDSVSRLSRSALESVFGGTAKGEDGRVRVVNGLPFQREDWTCVPFDGLGARVLDARCEEVPSYIENDRLWFQTHVEACATADYRIVPTGIRVGPTKECNSRTLENASLKLTVDETEGVTLIDKVSGAKLLDKVRDLLVLQGDEGSFQIERVVDSERHAWASPVRVERIGPFTLQADGCFADPTGIIPAEWTLIFTLRPGERFAGVGIRVNWQATGMRLRLKLATTLSGAGDGIYEIPFGVVRRRAYAPAFNRKGEWPTQRFAAIEDGQRGIALVNDGVPGVETLGGTVYTTLLRAPTEEYAGMVPDDSSQQHGAHEFRFALYPYEGGWEQSDVLALAQRWNQPLRVFTASRQSLGGSLLSVDNPKIVLHAVKPPEDGRKNIIVLRLSEGIGLDQCCVVRIPGVRRAWTADLRERAGEPIDVVNGEMSLHFKPWQIRTIIVERESET